MLCKAVSYNRRDFCVPTKWPRSRILILHEVPVANAFLHRELHNVSFMFCLKPCFGFLDAVSTSLQHDEGFRALRRANIGHY